MYQPEFVEGKNVAPPMQFDKGFLTCFGRERERYYWCSEEENPHSFFFETVKFEEQQYFKWRVPSSGVVDDWTFSYTFGGFNQDFTSAMIMDKYSEVVDGETVLYGLLPVDYVFEKVFG